MAKPRTKTDAEISLPSLPIAAAGAVPDDDAEEGIVIDPRPPKNPIEPLDANGRKIRWFRQCPLCFHGLGGVGNAKTTRGNKRYYGCNCCGHSWVITFRFEVVKLEHRVVDLQTRSEEQ
jgi:hypothetical protein